MTREDSDQHPSLVGEHRLQRRCVDNNRSTASRFDVVRAHRARVTDLVGQIARSLPNASRLCVLGAGNVNDLDLSRVLTDCAELHLVDIDGEAMERGVQRQGMAGEARIVIHGQQDLRRPWSHGLGFDIVLSAGMLSQLVDQARLTCSGGLVEVLDARDQHLAALVNLTRDAGKAILVTDVVSSMTVPGLEDATAAELAELLPRLIADSNFFTGCNPAALVNVFHTIDRVASVSATTPWIWPVSELGSYLTIGLVAEVAEASTLPKC